MKIYLKILFSAALIVGCGSGEDTSKGSTTVSNEENKVEGTVEHPKLGDYFEDFQDFYVFEYKNIVEGKGEMYHRNFAYAAENPYNKIKTVAGAEGEKVLDLEMSATASEEEIWPTLVRHIPKGYKFVIGNATEDGEAFHLKFDNPDAHDHIDVIGTTVPNDGEDTLELTLIYSVNTGSSEILLYEEEEDVGFVAADGNPEGATNEELMVFTKEQLLNALMEKYNGQEELTLNWDELTDYQKKLLTGFIYPCRGELASNNSSSKQDIVIQTLDAYSEHLSSVGEIPMEVMSFLYTLEEEGENFVELGCGL